jgi:hypothetical protein
VRPAGSPAATIAPESTTAATAEGADMGDELDSMGPVDYIVLEFPDVQEMRGEAFARLLDLVDGGLVRILDLVLLRKDDDGSVTVLQVADLDGDGELDLAVLEGATSGLVDPDDVAEAGGILQPGSAAAVLLYENRFARPLATALGRAGAELVASGRVPVASLLDALDAVETERPVDA